MRVSIGPTAPDTSRARCLTTILFLYLHVTRKEQGSDLYDGPCSKLSLILVPRALLQLTLEELRHLLRAVFQDVAQGTPIDANHVIFADLTH